MKARPFVRAFVALTAPVLVTASTMTPAQAVTTYAGIDLDTSASVDAWDRLTITATGSFTSSFIENTTVALQVVGTETYTDSAGKLKTVALEAHPTSVRFASSNTVTATFQLHADSTVHLNYNAEVAGLAPTAFTGHCTGEVIQVVGGSPGVVKTC